MEYVIRREGNEDYLEHYGTKGQKWGVRKYQNEDGSLTAEGREHYGYNQGWEARQQYKRGAKAVGSIIGTGLRLKYVNPAILKYGYNKTNKQTTQQLNSKVKSYVNS